MFHNESWKPIYFWVKRSRSRVTKTLPALVDALLWVLASSSAASVAIFYLCLHAVVWAVSLKSHKKTRFTTEQTSDLTCGSWSCWLSTDNVGDNEWRGLCVCRWRESRILATPSPSWSVAPTNWSWRRRSGPFMTRSVSFDVSSRRGLCLTPSVCLSVCLSVCVPVCVSVCLYLRLSGRKPHHVCITVHPSGRNMRDCPSFVPVCQPV